MRARERPVRRAATPLNPQTIHTPTAATSANHAAGELVINNPAAVIPPAMLSYIGKFNRLPDGLIGIRGEANDEVAPVHVLEAWRLR